MSVKTEKTGPYPFFVCSEDVLTSDTYSFDADAIIIVGFGTSLGVVHRYSGKFQAYQRDYVLTNFRGVDPQYLYHYCRVVLRNDLGKHKRDGSIPFITDAMIKDHVITLPTLEKQREIAKLLDKILALKDALLKEADLRNKEYSYYAQLLLNSNLET